MSLIKIDKENFVGVWENINYPPFAYNDKLEITFYLGANNTSNVNIEKNEDDSQSYFCDGFEVVKKENDQFQLILLNSKLNYGQDLILECRMYFPGVRPGMVCNFLEFGERYFERI